MFKISSNAEKIRNMVIANDNFCPCKPQEKGNLDYKCPCKNFITTYKCCCNMFTQEKIWGDDN